MIYIIISVYSNYKIVFIFKISVDGFFDSSLSMSPFLRLGIGCITAKNEMVDYSSVFFRAGVGVNYNITNNIFSYALMDYTFVPEGDIDDVDASVDGNVFSISFVSSFDILAGMILLVEAIPLLPDRGSGGWRDWHRFY